MKKTVFVIITMLALLLSALPASASTVTYSGDSGNFIFEPGSEHSPTDLFFLFKDVMPGDSITQKINVTNKASNKVKVKIYLRSLGAQDGSEEFLSKLSLKVNPSEQNEAPYMFDAAANQTAGLTDWVCLGTLYSGGSVDLDVVLNVPVELDNADQKKIGYIDWEFMVEEYPIEQTDPTLPDTSDNSQIYLWIAIAAGSVLLIIVLVLLKKKSNNKNS